jgi:hypothetical protein
MFLVTLEVLACEEIWQGQWQMNMAQPHLLQDSIIQLQVINDLHMQLNFTAGNTGKN